MTTLFWGVGATLQFAVLRWAADVLRLPLSQAAYLQAAYLQAAYLQTAVAIGVIAGAGIAGRWMRLHAAKRMLAGAVGGLMVVPLNALLQHRGYCLLSAGRSIAVQGFNEDASVLGMLAIYAGLLALDASIVSVMWGFGLCIAAAMSLLIWRSRRQVAVKPCAV